MDRLDLHRRAPVADGAAPALERLLEATRLLAPLQSEASVTQVIAESAAMVFDAPGAAVFLIDGDSLVLSAVSGGCGAHATRTRVARTRTGMWSAALTGAPIRVLGAEDAPDGWQEQCPALAMPMAVSKDVIGVLWITGLGPDAAQAVLDIFAVQAAAALDNARRCRAYVQSDRSRDAERATLAHELRNPLGAIMNALGVLERVGVPDVQAVRLRELIGRQARHLTRLVEDVLDVTRLRHGK